MLYVWICAQERSPQMLKRKIEGDNRVISCGGREDLGKWNDFCLLKKSWGCKRKYAKRGRCALDCLHHRHGSHRE